MPDEKSEEKEERLDAESVCKNCGEEAHSCKCIVESKVIAKLEQLGTTTYKKEYVAFVIKPLHIAQCHRWARWCSDRGLEKQHHKAFALAMDILEGKTQDIINSSTSLESLHRLVNTHDTIIANIISKLEEPEKKEELSPNEEARESVRKRKEAREKAKKEELKNKDKEEKNGSQNRSISW